VSGTGEPGKPGKHGGPGWGGAGGEGGRGGIGEGPGGRGGIGGSGGPGGSSMAEDYAKGRRRFRRMVMLGLVLASFSVFLSAWLFVRVQNAVDQSNRERAANVQRNCLETNDRHDNTIDALDTLLAVRLEAAQTKAERARLRDSRSNTVLLIDALSPRRDCDELVRRTIRAP
jgi:hypothetical protein